ncbi:MAG: hypothetical protein AAGA75_10080 [Cyanobacteria bacterium P01_E01_bin.6]
MIISDIKYIETSEEATVEGGLALAISLPVLGIPSGVTASGPNAAIAAGNVNIFATDLGAAGNVAGVTALGIAFAD